ncbi:hypothetical protein B0H21DRAFT_225991, partial [Amylocystis lapponica]
MASFLTTDDRLPVAKACHIHLSQARCSELSSRSAPRSAPSACSPAAEAPFDTDCNNVSLLQDQPPQSHLCCSHHRPYPSPPLTGSALRSNVPLPDICRDPHSQFSRFTSPEGTAHPDMTHQASCAHEPLSPPPTFLLGTLELPQTDLAFCSTRVGSPPALRPHHYPGGHDGGASGTPTPKRRSYASVVASGSGLHHDGPSSKVPRVTRGDSWEVQWGPQVLDVVPDDMSTAPHLTPSRIDSGFEESPPSQECHDGETNHCDLLVAPYTVIEPTSYWSPQSPVNIHEPLPTDDYLSDDLGDPGGSPFSSPLLGFSQQSTPHSWDSMDWSPSSEPESDYSPPSSPRPQSLSLDLQGLDHVGTSD